MRRFLSSLLMFVAVTAFAQTPPTKQNTTREQKTPEERAALIANRLEKSLVLSADQKTKVHDLVLTKEKKIDQLRQQNKGKDRCDWADQRTQTINEFNSGMKQVLTPDQFTKWTAQKEEQKKKHTADRSHSSSKGVRSDKTPEQRADTLTLHLEKNLGLTADQKTKVRNLILSREKANDQLREKYKGQDPCSSSAERKQVRENFENGMKATLTPEQYKKWEEQKKQRMERRKN